MKKYILTIIMIVMLAVPLALFADKPIFTDGDGGDGWTGGSGTGGSGGTTTSSSTSIKSKLFVETDEASNVTYTTAILNGIGGDKSTNPTLPITAYFRYSKAAISPIFCNDIYGTNMKSTGDENLGVTSSKSFSKKISNLTPDTTYYYCAIISNRENIAYGGSSIVKEFHTSPNKTSIKTASAEDVGMISAKLKGFYSSVETVKTYFEYKKSSTETTSDWIRKGEETHVKEQNLANIYGDVYFNLANLSAGTRYQFRLVVENNSGEETKTFYGTILNFTTSPDDGEGDGICTNGATNYPECTSNEDTNKCLNGATNYPTCTTNDAGNCFNGATNPPACTVFPNGTCTNGATNPPSCTTLSNGNCANGATNPPSCTSITLGTSGRPGGSGRNGGGGSDGTRNNSNNSGGTNNNVPKYLGQVIAPPVDAIVRSQEGIEHVFVRQIIANQTLATMYGYQTGTDLQNFAWYLADELAKMFGYINENGKEIRVSYPDIAAYQLQLTGDKLTVYEYYDGRIIDIRNITTEFKNKSDYEYYFKK